MGKVEPIAPYLEPLRKDVRVPLTPEGAFELFTAGLSRWWPLATHSVFEGRARACGIEPRVGGSLWEEVDASERSVWGTVLVWEPPVRFVVTWHPGGEPATAQEVEVQFLADGDGALVKLEHRGWARLGDRASEAREGYSKGWVGVLGRYVEVAGGGR